MKPEDRIVGLEHEPPVFMLKQLSVRLLAEHEHVRAGELLEQEHYLGDCPGAAA